jgi:DNA polymerase-1
MKIATFDIEANGFIDDVTKIHCIVIKPLGGECELYEPDEIDKAITNLQGYDKLIAHNGIDYDANVIKKLHNVELYDKVVDTLLLSKLDDGTRHSHSLKSLGLLFELEVQKQEYNGGFDRYTPEMGSYCIDDVKTNELLYLKLMENLTDLPEFSMNLEHQVRILQTKAANHGVLFDERLASSTLIYIEDRMQEIKDSLDLGYYVHEHAYNKTKSGDLSHHTKKKIKQLTEANIKHEVREEIQTVTSFTDGDLIAVDDQGVGIYSTIQEEEQVAKTIVSEFIPITPDTKKQLHTHLLKEGWKPTFLTPKGSPKIVENGVVCPNLEAMGEEFGLLSEYYMLKHRQALIKGLVDVVRRDGRIPSEADTLGAVTHRYTHRKIANFPRVTTLLGSEIRAMFTVPDDKVLIGADLAGLELRMLAHYMNDANYTKELLEGDIHTANQKAAGLPTRDNAKTFILI